jgi:hypothetical protein
VLELEIADKSFALGTLATARPTEDVQHLGLLQVEPIILCNFHFSNYYINHRRFFFFLPPITIITAPYTSALLKLSRCNYCLKRRFYCKSLIYGN